MSVYVLICIAVYDSLITVLKLDGLRQIQQQNRSYLWDKEFIDYWQRFKGSYIHSNTRL